MRVARPGEQIQEGVASQGETRRDLCESGQAWRASLGRKWPVKEQVGVATQGVVHDGVARLGMRRSGTLAIQTLVIRTLDF